LEAEAEAEVLLLLAMVVPVEVHIGEETIQDLELAVKALLAEITLLTTTVEAEEVPAKLAIPTVSAKVEME
jgi:hypothetical protein